MYGFKKRRKFSYDHETIKKVYDHAKLLVRTSLNKLDQEDIQNDDSSKLSVVANPVYSTQNRAEAFTKQILMKLYKSSFTLGLQGADPSQFFESEPMLYGSCPDFLQNINEGILSARMLKMLDFLPTSHFYGGNVLVEIRDFRLQQNEIVSDSDQFNGVLSMKLNSNHPNGFGVKKSNSCLTTQVVLQPDHNTLKNEILSIVNETESKIKWNESTKLQLECCIFELNTGSICLDPDPALYPALKMLPECKNFLNSDFAKNPFDTNFSFTPYFVSDKSKYSHTTVPSPKLKTTSSNISSFNTSLANTSLTNSLDLPENFTHSKQLSRISLQNAKKMNTSIDRLISKMSDQSCKNLPNIYYRFCFPFQKTKNKEIVTIYKMLLDPNSHYIKVFNPKHIEGQFDESELDKYDIDVEKLGVQVNYSLNSREKVESTVKNLIDLWSVHGKRSCIVINEKNMKFTFTDYVDLESKGGNLHNQSDLSWLYPTKSIIILPKNLTRLPDIPDHGQKSVVHDILPESGDNKLSSSDSVSSKSNDNSDLTICQNMADISENLTLMNHHDECINFIIN